MSLCNIVSDVNCACSEKRRKKKGSDVWEHYMHNRVVKIVKIRNQKRFWNENMDVEQANSHQHNFCQFYHVSITNLRRRQQGNIAKSRSTLLCKSIIFFPPSSKLNHGLWYPNERELRNEERIWISNRCLSIRAAAAKKTHFEWINDFLWDSNKIGLKNIDITRIKVSRYRAIDSLDGNLMIGVPRGKRETLKVPCALYLFAPSKLCVATNKSSSVLEFEIQNLIDLRQNQ